MKNITIKQLGVQDYETIFNCMRKFTATRNKDTPDEIWILQHPPVFTQGKGGKAEHILQETNISIVQSDRGGQVTYHGPGQLIIYFLIDLKRRSMHLRDMIDTIEQSIIKLLASYNITGHLIEKQPGVYVDNKKIASLGLHIKKGCCYHGLSLNVDMDLTPFSYINPCGYKNLEMTQMKNLGCEDSIDIVAEKLLNTITKD
jgi:lipoyl(octanoyl) transferase